MLLHYLKCRKKTESKILSVEKTNKENPMLLSNSELCGNKKSRFFK